MSDDLPLVQLWPYIALFLLGAGFIAAGSTLHTAATRALRQLPEADRRKAVSYLEGKLDLRRDLDLSDLIAGAGQAIIVWPASIP